MVRWVQAYGHGSFKLTVRERLKHMVVVIAPLIQKSEQVVGLTNNFVLATSLEMPIRISKNSIFLSLEP